MLPKRGQPVIFLPDPAHLFFPDTSKLSTRQRLVELGEVVASYRVDIPGQGETKGDGDLERLDVTYVEDPNLSRVASVCFLELMPDLAERVAVDPFVAPGGADVFEMIVNLARVNPNMSHTFFQRHRRTPAPPVL